LAYGQSKTPSVLLAVEADRRWGADGITANAVMPCGIWTNLQRHVSDEVRAGWARLTSQRAPRLANDDAVEATHPDVREGALGPVAAERLWEISLALLEAPFPAPV